ncbi:MAG: LysR substrate-binding domain-containing protein [Sedimenticola sp.]
MDKKITSKLARQMSLRQLQVFESVARLLSYTRAAEELFLSQPTVSMQIKKLESDIELPLTEQTGKKISLTDTGKALYEATQDIFGTLNRLEMLINDQKGLHSGQLRVAVVTTANYFMPRLLGRFCQEYPGINVSLEVTNREHILERMSENLDDLYLIGEPPKSIDLEFKPYLANPMVVIAPADHPLAKQKSISIAKIAKEPFITREQGSGTRIAMENLFNNAGHQLNVRLELGNNESIKQAVLGGLGLSVLSLHTITTGDINDLAVLDVQSFPIPWQWHIGHPKGKQLSIAAKTFIDYMYKEGPSLIVKTGKP